MERRKGLVGLDPDGDKSRALFYLFKSIESGRHFRSDPPDEDPEIPAEDNRSFSERLEAGFDLLSQEENDY